MKILHAVQFYHPAVGGMEEVVKQLSERLAALGHRVFVLTSYNDKRKSLTENGVEIVEFAISGNMALGFKGNLQDCREYIENNDFDIVTLFAAQQWATDIFFLDNLLKKLTAKKVFVPTGFSGLYDNRYEAYFNKMKNWFHDFDMSIFLSNNYRDINFAKESGVSKFILIPNGADENEFTDFEKPKNENGILRILHVGNHTGQKGHHELIKIYRKSKVENTELLIVGKKCWKGRCYLKCQVNVLFTNIYFKLTRKRKKVILKSINRQETIQKYKDADLFLFPSNIECSPIVLFEACASKTPFLSSCAGNASEIVEWTNGGKILPSTRNLQGRTELDIENSVIMLDDLLIDKEEREKMSLDGYRSWKEKFSWRAISIQYEQLYFDLLGDGK